MSRNLRNRPRIVSPAVLRLWNFHPEHVRDGPADGVPITITARPLDVDDPVSDQEYFQHLVQGFHATLEALVRNYLRRNRFPAMTRAQIRRLPVFFYPTDLRGQGEQIRTRQGRTTLNDLTVVLSTNPKDLIMEIFNTAQSGDNRTVHDLMWTVVLNPDALLQRALGKSD